MFAPLPLCSAGEPRTLTLLESLQLVQQLIVVALVTKGSTAPHGARDLTATKTQSAMAQLVWRERVDRMPIWVQQPLQQPA